MSEIPSFQDRIDALARVADAAEVFTAASTSRVQDRLRREIVRRGYDIEGKTDDEIIRIISLPPTLPEQP